MCEKTMFFAMLTWDFIILQIGELEVNLRKSALTMESSQQPWSLSRSRYTVPHMTCYPGIGPRYIPSARSVSQSFTSRRSILESTLNVSSASVWDTA